LVCSPTCCVIENSSQYVLAWKRDIAVLTAGNVKVTVNPRIRLMPVQAHTDPHGSLSTGYNLEIRDVRNSDAGDYICQIGSMEPKEIVHTLEILVPPKIDYISPSNKMDIHKGAPIRMECRASGNPTPKIVWSRKNNMMPNGEANKTGNVLDILHANRHSSGHYKCTADNRVGQPDTREVFILQKLKWNNQLCIVESVTRLSWCVSFMESLRQNRGNKYSLVIRNVTYSDIGNYTCQASNALGKDRGTLSLSGLPTLCYFDSPTLSSYRDQYNISWTVQSYSPIREYRLFFRLASKSMHLLHHENPLDNHIYSDRPATNSHLYSSPFSGSVSAHGGDQWENVVIPEMNDYGAPNHFYNMVPPYATYQPTIRHRMSFQLKNLKPASNYEARVQARNDHGWNKLSSIFHFSTRSEDMELEPSAQPAVHGAGLLDKGLLSSSDASTITGTHFHKSWTLSIFIVLITTHLLPSLYHAALSVV
uniref:Ig-like domain-containing protein n=1 Tax=Anopheles coluzzii TaxID=1518534 RepID=A0A8W7Q0E6_ANOCL